MHLKPISRDLRRDLYKRMPGDGMIVRKRKKKTKSEEGKENKKVEKMPKTSSTATATKI